MTDTETEIVGKSWKPHDLKAYLDGTFTPAEPTILYREDTDEGAKKTDEGAKKKVALIYPGLTHWIAGEPESMKSWIALLAVTQILEGGDRVLYLDFEDNAGSVTSRLLSLGAESDAVRERLSRMLLM